MIGLRQWVAGLIGVGTAASVLSVAGPPPVNAAPTRPGPSPAAAPAVGTNGRPDFQGSFPIRVLDTRIGLGAAKAPVGPGRAITVQLTGAPGIPASGVSAVVLNLTAVAPTAGGYLTVYPTGATRPTASTLNFVAGQTVANEVIATLGTNGRVSIFNAAGTTHVLADVTGWFATGSYYHPLTPARVLDTRTGLGTSQAAVGAGRTITVPVTGHGGVPATGATAVAVNVTATAPTTDTYVTAFPTGQPRPVASNLNLVGGQTAAVLVVASLGTNGTISLYNNAGNTHLVADVTGWFAPTGQFTPITPSRFMDTRVQGGPLAPGASRIVLFRRTVPASTENVILSVTAVAPTATGYLSVQPEVDPLVQTSALNFRKGQTVPNMVVTPVSSFLGILITNHSSGTVQVVVDLSGYFVALPRFGGVLTLPAATLPAPYNTTVSVTGGIPPYSWQLPTDPLPPGLHLAPTDPQSVSITGTPTTPGTYTVTIRVVDSRQNSAEHTWTLVVRPFVSGAVWSWGLGQSGELGIGSDGRRNVPGRINDLSGVTSVAGGDLSGYALKSDGTVWAWGWNNSGQMGDGTTTDRLVPVRVSGLTGVTAIAATAASGYALRADGTVWAWGRNTFGELGDGTTITRLTPVQVHGLAGITAVDGKGASGYAIGKGGTVWAWGRNLDGELGDGTTTDRLTPVQVAGLTGITAVAGGRGFALAVKANGTVWAWGYNGDGELGDDTTTDRLTPVQVSGLTGITAVAAGTRVSYALTSDGAVWAWGYGRNGNLGTGNTTFSTTPIRIAWMPPATALAAGSTAAYVVGTS